MANGNKTLIVCASVFCIVAMLLGMDPAHAAPAPASSGDLEAGERDVSKSLYLLFAVCLAVWELCMKCYFSVCLPNLLCFLLVCVFFKAAILYYAARIADLTGGPTEGSGTAGNSLDSSKKKRNNAELINGLLGMNLGQLDLAGKK